MRRALLRPPRLVEGEPDRALDERLEAGERRLPRSLEKGRGDLERLGVPRLENKALRAARLRLVHVAAGVDLREPRGRLVEELVRLGEASFPGEQPPQVARAERGADRAGESGDRHLFR